MFAMPGGRAQPSQVGYRGGRPTADSIPRAGGHRWLVRSNVTVDSSDNVTGLKSLGLLDSDRSNALVLAVPSNISSDRSLLIYVPDADSTMQLTAWTSAAVTPSAASGSSTWTATAWTRSAQVGKLVFLTGIVEITTPGIAGGSIILPLPVTANQSIVQPIQGNEYFQTGSMCSGVIGSSGTAAFIARYDGATIIGSSRKIVIGGVYEAA